MLSFEYIVMEMMTMCRVAEAAHLSAQTHQRLQPVPPAR
jgi:hypothetical protein